jgi:hypothetical protein
MPTSLRNSRRRLSFWSTACPATSMRPDWNGSRPLIQRSIVLLPEPLRPMTATTWPGLDGQRNALQNLDRTEALVNIVNDHDGHGAFLQGVRLRRESGKQIRK